MNGEFQRFGRYGHDAEHGEVQQFNKVELRLPVSAFLRLIPYSGRFQPQHVDDAVVVIGRFLHLLKQVDNLTVDEFKIGNPDGVFAQGVKNPGKEFRAVPSVAPSGLIFLFHDMNDIIPVL